MTRTILGVITAIFSDEINAIVREYDTIPAVNFPIHRARKKEAERLRDMVIHEIEQFYIKEV